LAAADLKSSSLLAFSLALRFLFCGAEPLERIDPAVLDNLRGVYAPERDALKAELYGARGDDASYKRLRSETLASTPGLAWWFQMIDEGGAFLKSFSTRPR
jgi:hypothetical protein